MDGADFEEAIFHVRSSTRWARRREDPEVQSQELLLPLSVLKGGTGGFMAWSRRVARSRNDAERIALEDALDRIQAKWIQAIDDYHFPVVTLSETTKPDALCTIFETLNRTGVKLSVFELLTARFWPQNINLRGLWDSALASYPIIKEFEVDPYYILQGIALASRRNPSCKRSDVLNLATADIDEWWNKVIESLALGLEILRDDCKVIVPKWIPYQTMLPPLAAVLARIDQSHGPEAGVRREKIKRWFWCAVFGQVYESAPNSQSAKDVSECVAWLQGGAEPEAVALFRFDPKTLRDTTPRQRSIYRGSICLILGLGARDFHTQSIISARLINDEGIDDHHVFPDAYLERQGVSQRRLRDCVLNRTLIDRTTNQMIQDRRPSEYLADIRNTPGFPFQEILASHGLPAKPDSPLLRDDFEGFLSWRQNSLWEAIRAATGAIEAADLESEEDETA